MKDDEYVLTSESEVEVEAPSDDIAPHNESELYQPDYDQFDLAEAYSKLYAPDDYAGDEAEGWVWDSCPDGGTMLFALWGNLQAHTTRPAWHPFYRTVDAVYSLDESAAERMPFMAITAQVCPAELVRYAQGLEDSVRKLRALRQLHSATDPLIGRMAQALLRDLVEADRAYAVCSKYHTEFWSDWTHAIMWLVLAIHVAAAELLRNVTSDVNQTAMAVADKVRQIPPC
jgi:hypothetical protein